MFQLTNKREVEAFIKGIVRKLDPMIRLFQVYAHSVTIVVRDGRGVSRGGKKDGPWMKIDGIYRFMDQDFAEFVEYDHIRHRKDIGSYEGPAYKALAVLVAHELAHVVQYCGSSKEIDILANSFDADACPRRNSGHGKDWQAIYATLRKVALDVADAVASEVNDLDVAPVAKKVDDKKSYDVSVESKLCSRCNDVKAANLFYKHVRSKDGLNAWCKLCVLDHKKFGKK